MAAEDVSQTPGSVGAESPKKPFLRLRFLRDLICYQGAGPTGLAPRTPCRSDSGVPSVTVKKIL